MLEVFAKEEKDFIANEREHVFSTQMSKFRPAKMFAFFPEDWVFHGLVQGHSFFLFLSLGLVEHADEHEVGDLLDYRDGVGNASAVKVEPEGVDFGSYVLGGHESGLVSEVEKSFWGFRRLR